MPQLNLLIKPASSLCNMGCRYCFYRDVADNRNTRSFGIMSEDTLNAMMKNVFAYADTAVSFTFQGGEPTLAGEKFFLAFHRAVERYNTRRIPTSFFLQTNGYDISDGLMRIFAAYRYLLGVSLDGEPIIHDAFRTTLSGEGTSGKIIETLHRLDRYRIDYNILTVITERLARGGSETYKYLRDCGYRFLQFIPFVSDFGKEGEKQPYTLTNESYAHFLTETFREYRNDFINGRYVSVRQFDNFVRIAAGLPAECCGMGGRCFANLVIEADGGAYPCDFYVLDKWKMGNITENSVSELFESEAAKSFVKDSFIAAEECVGCRYFGICKGGCRRHREDAYGSLSLNRYCDAYKSFFESSISLISDMASRLCKK